MAKHKQTHTQRQQDRFYPYRTPNIPRLVIGIVITTREFLLCLVHPINARIKPIELSVTRSLHSFFLFFPHDRWLDEVVLV